MWRGGENSFPRLVHRHYTDKSQTKGMSLVISAWRCSSLRRFRCSSRRLLVDVAFLLMSSSCWRRLLVETRRQDEAIDWALIELNISITKSRRYWNSVVHRASLIEWKLLTTEYIHNASSTKFSRWYDHKISSDQSKKSKLAYSWSRCSTTQIIIRSWLDDSTA